MRVSLMPPDLMVSVGFGPNYIDVHKNRNAKQRLPFSFRHSRSQKVTE